MGTEHADYLDRIGLQLAADIERRAAKTAGKQVTAEPQDVPA
jgi:hypothetical protein